MSKAEKRFHVGGVESVLEMLRVMDAPARDRLLELLGERDEKLAASLRSQIYVFADLIHLTAKETQLLLRNINNDDLVLALKTAGPALAEHFYANLSQRVSSDLRDQLKAMGPRLARDVEKSQEKILGVAKDLATSGKIILKKSESNEMV